MSIHTDEEFEKLKAIGKIVRWSLDEMSAAVRSGITTLELDHIGLRMLKQHGAEAAPPKVYGFPGAVCICVNDEAVGRPQPFSALRAHYRNYQRETRSANSLRF